MNYRKQQSKCLASLAVFRELYDSQKDVYGIISEFLKELIINSALHQFNLTEITNLLNETYDFNIPEAVVKTSINRLNFIKKNQGLYTAENIAQLKSNNILEKQLIIQQNNNLLIDGLFNFIKDSKKVELSESEKEKIVNSFCSFILGETDEYEYSDFVSAYIITNNKNKEFIDQLNTIKEGVVLYSGIKYTSNLNDIGSWNTELTIFIDTEVLFHFAGYNGELYQSLFNDFFSFVKEINQRPKKKLIQLKYFREVKDEIERFYKKAEFIIEGKGKADPSVTAMTSILKGCSSPSDIIMKKTKFYNLLRANGILEDDYSNYFAEYNYKYNIIDQQIIKNVSESLGIEDITDYLRFLNFISIHRKEANCNNFDNVGFILLTGNTNTLRVAWDEKIKKQGNVPLATDLNFLTNKFWFKLNKGFGTNSYPKSFDIITKAQIVLSTHLNKSVSQQFDDLQLKFKNKEITEEEVVATIAALRTQARKPEEIKEDEISDILGTISETSIEKYLQEQSLLKDKAKKQEEENIKLKEEIIKKNIQIQEQEQEKNNYQDRLNKELKEKEEELNKYKEIERKNQNRKEKRKRIWKKIALVFISLILIGLAVYLYFINKKIFGIIKGVK